MPSPTRSWSPATSASRRASDVGRRTIFDHFATKEAILFEDLLVGHGSPWSVFEIGRHRSLQLSVCMP